MYQDIRSEVFLVQLFIVRKLTKISNNLGLVKQTVVHLYYVKIMLYKSIGPKKIFTVFI